MTYLSNIFLFDSFPTIIFYAWVLGPFFCSYYSLLFGRFLGYFNVQIVTCIVQCWMLLSSILMWLYININQLAISLCLGTWCFFDNLIIKFEFKFTTFSVTMLTLVTIVAAMVFFYSIYYMEYDPHIVTFWGYVFLFEFFMFVLVAADNFLMLIVGWEGIGLCSYLLIGFWYTRLAANKAAMKAMIVNSIGDTALFISTATFAQSFQTINFDLLNALLPFMHFEKIIFFTSEVYVIELISIFLLLSVISKSAQIGLHIWLSDAMEGPTPVSALIHAATMVTAGIYLIIRTSFLFELSQTVLTFMVVVGSLTAFVAATIAFTQNDIKKVIAFSTCSQLGYMLFCCGLSSYSVAFFHLVTHAFFKALLFLTAGAVIHALGGEQDIRKMGSLAKILPLTYIMMLIGSLALAGFPALAGFYSKDFILELSMANLYFDGRVASWLGLSTAFLTAFYSVRLLILVFGGTSSVPNGLASKVHEINKWMAIPLIILTIGSIFAGYFLKDFFIGLGSDAFSETIFPSINNNNFVAAEFLPLKYKLLPFFFSTFGLIVGFFIYSQKYLTFFFPIYNILSNFKYKDKLVTFTDWVYKLSINKWFFDRVYLHGICLNILKFSYDVLYKFWHSLILKQEKTLIYFTYQSSNYVKTFHNGDLTKYIFIICVAMTISCFFI